MARKKNLNDDQSTDKTENNDDTFGLPEIEYEPLKREETTVQAQETIYNTTSESEPEPDRGYEREEVHEEVTNTYQDDDEEASSPWPKILGVLALVLVAGLAYWFFGVYQPKQRAAAEKARLEQEAREAAERRAEEARLAEEKRKADEQRRADSLANLTPKEGTIETLSERTRRYYVVISSAIDGDLIMDNAKRLSQKGVSTKIIPPFGKAKFYRLAVAEGETYTDAQATADGLKSDYGGEVWVVKY